MACVGAAGITDHYIGTLGQKIHNLAFSFIAPLGADYNDR